MNDIQLPLLGFEAESNTGDGKITNVASVPQRSVFRYPGGKTWLIPTIRQWFHSFTKQPEYFIEPFAGGGIVSLTVAFEKLAKHVIMVERDEEVASVWKTILGSDRAKLSQYIIDFKLTPENLDKIFELPAKDEFETAFRTILRNRTNRGGILASGAGRIKVGENGKGLLSRWYPETLARRINDLAHVSDSITFLSGDGLHILSQYLNHDNSVFFIDPPYTAGGKKAGSRLYKYFELDHELLFSLMSKSSANFLMTYDDAAEVRGLCEKYDFSYKHIAMKSTHHAEVKELIISRDLTWYSN